MGGLGSGRHEYATTPLVGNALQVDADNITDGVEHPGATGRAEWNGTDADLDLTIHFERLDDADTDRATHLRFEYTVADSWSDRTTHNEHRVALEYTEPHFGGVRPWFRCPGVVNGETCGRRVRKLYFPRGAKYWFCRECYDLGYVTSRRSSDDVRMAELRYRHAFKKADAEDRRPHPNNSPHSPDRPKGMHHDTFDELVADVEDAREEWNREMNRKMIEMLDAYTDGEAPLASPW